jgi:hypothetical protein
LISFINQQTKLKKLINKITIFDDYNTIHNLKFYGGIPCCNDPAARESASETNNMGSSCHSHSDSATADSRHLESGAIAIPFSGRN